MLTLEQAQNLVAWVCTHDDGTPQPRAHIYPLAEPDWGWGVAINSYEAHADGTLSIDTDFAYSVAGARSILGY